MENKKNRNEVGFTYVVQGINPIVRYKSSEAERDVFISKLVSEIVNLFLILNIHPRLMGDCLRETKKFVDENYSDLLEEWYGKNPPFI